MTSPAIVPVHGGQHAGDYWEPTGAEIERQAPGTQVLAVDLPRRRSDLADLADLAEVTVADRVASTIAQIDVTGITEFVVVGYSMAGLTVPGVVAKLGPSRVRRMILMGAAVVQPGAPVPRVEPSDHRVG